MLLRRAAASSCLSRSLSAFAGRPSALPLSPLALGRRLLSTQLEVPIPELGAESIVEGDLLSLGKGVGDYVAAEEMVAEIETDKVTIEAKSPQAGTITAIHVEVGQTVEVGNKFFTLALGGDAPPPPAPEAAKVPMSAPVAPAAAPAAPTAAAAAAPAAAPSLAFSGGSNRVHPSGKPSLMRFPLRGAAEAAARSVDANLANTVWEYAMKGRTQPIIAAPLGTGISYDDLPARFKPKPISEEEMLAIETGGADFTF